MKRRWSGMMCVMACLSAQADETGNIRLLDGFEDASPWRVVTSNQVSGALRQVAGVNGKALCLDYDFNGVSGYAGIQRDLPLDYPDNYRFSFRLRGDPPGNDLQFKLVDASGDNVWWVNSPRYDFPREWREENYKRRHISRAWGPGQDPQLRHSAKLEFTIYNNVGGKGSVCFDELKFQPLPAESDAPLTAVPSTDTAPVLAKAIADGKSDAAWYSQGTAEQTVLLDLGSVREFGGAIVQWAPGAYASHYVVRGSEDGRNWRKLREVVAGNGGTDWLALPESQARYLRFDLKNGPGWRYGIREIGVQPLAFAATPNDFIRAVARQQPKGRFPRGFSDEQPYWTIVGIDGGLEQGLIGEDGAIEVGKGGFSIEPFVIVDGKALDWSHVRAAQSLLDGYLPMPSVEWRHDKAVLKVSAFAQGQAEQSQLVVRYRLSNPGKEARDYSLALAVQPFQVNPPTQFLSTVGGVSRIESLAFDGASVVVAGKPRVFANRMPDAAFASAFDAGMAAMHLGAGDMPADKQVKDGTGLASGAMLYRMQLQSGESRDVDLMIPLTGAAPALAEGWNADAMQRAVAEQWRDKLDRVRIQVPAQGQALVDTLRTSLAHMLISRVGPRLQPGTRSYSRSWIRDGAMISEGLLRMGREDAVRDYVDWYAPYQFANGMVPCCVDARGSDPVPENDSHGELIFNIAEYYRYTGDHAFLERMWPHVLGAYEYMEALRLSERTEENRALNPAFYGMMPVSISHEGYSAKPMHSYWDNFWTLRGYKDAADVAQWLGRGDAAMRMAASRDQFREDLLNSLQEATRLHGIDFLPGAAELGDFDATSTTIALAPGGEQGRLPKELLESTFERYWQEFVQRRDGKREWKDYTPYEWRNVAAFVRLGWRERAWEAVDFFFKDRAPQPWNQWAEVVSSTPRKPFFVGDLPHAWVGSDFVRSALDMFAYQREIDDSIVLAAGIPADWLDGEGIAIHGLRTPHGQLSYALRRQDGVLALIVEEGINLPSGGLVLPWPYKGKPGKALINGEPVEWVDRELRIISLPASVEIGAR